MKLKLFVINKAWQKGCVGKGENVQHITTYKWKYIQ